MKVDSKPAPTCSMCGSRCSSSWHRMSCTLDPPYPTCIEVNAQTPSDECKLTVHTHQCKKGDKLCNACKKYWFKNMTPRPRQWRSDIVYGSGQYRRQRGMQNTKVWAECTKTKAVAQWQQTNVSLLLDEINKCSLKKHKIWIFSLFFVYYLRAHILFLRVEIWVLLKGGWMFM